ncbi:lecithin retinol acyltransferase family protein [Cupriavidus sp. 2SB]|uniref:lecithin retinol acyltransferase family protein n=1 Tax=Cupriavidus sp. 2SB TaxID=2502199 RepID=UPI0010F71151|nr:lecithin retinol acyltransferase family protein [Cupriavidus sp. 2SB]
MDTSHIDLLQDWDAANGVARQLRVGAHLTSARDGYLHHGIYVGNGMVIHYGGFDRVAKCRPVEYISLRRFGAGVGVTVRPESEAAYPGHEVADRARSRLGEDRYQLLTNNCEHFCAWCVSGVARSEQVYRCLRNPWAGLRMLMALLRGMREPAGLTASA